MKEQSLMRTVPMTAFVCGMDFVIRLQERIFTHVLESAPMAVMEMVSVNLIRERMKTHVRRIVVVEAVEEVAVVML